MISELTLNLANGNIEIKLDALEQIACASNVRSIYLDLEQMPEFDDMVQVSFKVRVNIPKRNIFCPQCYLCFTLGSQRAHSVFPDTGSVFSQCRMPR